MRRGSYAERFGPVTSAALFAPPCGLGLRTFSLSTVARQLQHREQIIERTHGAGLVKHVPMTNVDLSRITPRGVSQAPPPADLSRTGVHEGLGTGPQDPYTRTLPNQESRPPGTTVLQSSAQVAPTLDETTTLGRKWGTLLYWVGDVHPRLPAYLRLLCIPRALPVSTQAEALVSDFGARLPSILTDATDEQITELSRLWAESRMAYEAVSTQNVFDRKAFEAELHKLHQQTLSSARRVSGTEDQVLLAFEVLRRKAVLQRNRFIEESLLRPVESDPSLGHSDAVWRTFFEAAEEHRALLLTDDGSRVLEVAWDAVRRENAAHTPALTAVVALYLVLLSLGLRSAAVASPKAGGQRGASGTASAGVDTHRQNTLARLRAVPAVEQRRFAQKTAREILSTADGASQLSKALRSHGLYELSREAALCEAMNDTQKLAEEEVGVLLEVFDSVGEVKTVLSRILSSGDNDARKHVLETFQCPPSATSVDWEKQFLSVDWNTNWRRLVTTLLADTATLTAVHSVVRQGVASKKAVNRLFSPSYEQALTLVSDARSARAKSKAAKVELIAQELGTYRLVAKCLEIFSDLGISLDELAAAAPSLQSSSANAVPAVTAKVLSAVLAAVRQRHPSWTRAGVLGESTQLSGETPDGQLDSKGQLQALEAMLRMYVRLSYVPHAGAAAIAQHTRRRIGPVAKEPYQYNVPAEVGFVEQYDNLQYKRYDWQGWYQRMVDVHNRNVSVRVRISDLKRLDGYGKAFVDMQTERRLRVLAGDRVGMGVLKLDSDKYEDQSDNITHGTKKLSELFADSRKAQLGPEYWPTVEVKVRRPSGQSQAHYSVIDNDRIEKRSQELYAKYREAKKRALFVAPMDLWLDVKGMQTRKTSDAADAQGYTIDTLQNSLGDE